MNFYVLPLAIFAFGVICAVVILLLDDLQWCDQDTLEWLHYLLRFDPGAPLLIVGTMRTEEVGPRHPLTTLLNDLRGTGQLTEISLGPLDAAETAELGMCVAGRDLDQNEARRLYDETEGQPLYVVETVRAGLTDTDRTASAEPRPSTLGGAASASSYGRLPPKVHAVISARLTQLSDSARATVSLAATIGRAFALDVLIQATDDDVDSLVGALDELWQRRIVREHGTSAYDFSHDKLREVAYGEMSAARLAQRVYANAEAIFLLNKGLALLASQPPSQQRDELELGLQTALGTSLVATAGYGASETLRVYTRSQELCQHLGKPPSPPVLRALAIASLAQAEFHRAHGLGDHLLSLATRDRDPVLMVEGHYVLGVTLFWKGALAPSREHLEQAGVEVRLV